MNKNRFLQLIFIVVLFACKTGSEATDTVDTANTGNATAPPAALSYRIVKEYPHDPAAFTQGLVWHNGHLLEGTGQYGASNIRKVELATGKVVKQVSNTDDIFGEGITVLNGKLYQITWKNRKAFVYDAQTFKQLQELNLFTEGWGLTHNGKELILSDGSSNIYFLDPATFSETRRISVQDHMGPRGNINELELVNGRIYANVWQSDDVLQIDPASGRVLAEISFADLRGKTGISAPGFSETGPDVLNGIAYDSSSGKLFITGKYWPKLFEIRVGE